MNTFGFLETIGQDLRYSLRTMRQSPAFAITAVLTLALGIGGNTAIFTVIRTVLLKPLEYRDPDRLVRISVDNPPRNIHDISFSPLQFEQLSAARSFAEIGAFTQTTENVTLSGGAGPEALVGARVSGSFLHILGVQPMLGRSFLPEEDTPGAPAVALLSARLWKRRFGADHPWTTGQTVTLDSVPSTIIGVLPPGFQFPFPGVNVWLTRPSEWSAVPPVMRPRVGSLIGFGRLQPRVALDAARAELNVLLRQYISDHPGLYDADPRASMRVVRLQDQLVANVRLRLWMLFGAVGFVLAIACANIASLLLARSASRAAEFAVRVALGASRGRMISQLLTESLLLAFAGGALGALLAEWALSAVARVSALDLPRAGEIRLDGLVLAFTVALCIATGVLFGLFPSLRASRPHLAGLLRDRGQGLGRPSGLRRFGLSAHGLLVISQVALSVMLLIGAALLLESFVRLRGLDPGFQSANLMTINIPLPPLRYDNVQKRMAFWNELVRRVQALPGVRGATVSLTLPLASHYLMPMQVAEQPVLKVSERPMSQIQSVTPGYFQVLGIPLRRGRDFTPQDGPGAPPVIIINESMARRYWPEYPRGPNPVGQHMLVGGTLEIVGIIADTRDSNLTADPQPQVYVLGHLRSPQIGGLMVRTGGDPLRFVNAIRSQVLALDRDLPISDVRAMDEVMQTSIGQQRLTLLLLGCFAAVALLLATVGIYGVIAYAVVQRTPEVGIRRALGAQHRDILRLLLGQGLALALGGVALGAGGALALTRVMKTLLFQVSATDPATYLCIALLFVTVALAASYLPARRATRIDPMAALR
jgi:putative ABC transport system permease protein